MPQPYFCELQLTMPVALAWACLVVLQSVRGEAKQLFCHDLALAGVLQVRVVH